MLCDTCISLIRNVDRPPHLGQRTTKTLEALINSIDQGCYTCTKRRISMTDEEWAGLLSSSVGVKTKVNYVAARIKRLSTNPAKSLILTISIRGWSHRIYFHEDNSSVGSVSDKASLASLSTADPAVLKLAKCWLNDCTNTHSRCGRGHKTTDKLPDRLIDLQPPGHPKSSWQLLRTSDQVIREPYATLSHRWWDITKAINRHTETSMMNGLPLDVLPPVFKDAVKIAKYLGVRYLWIDNPCIPQQAFDISVQAAKMAEVFGGAEFNISALTARGDAIFSSKPTGSLSSTGFLDRDQYQLSNSYILDFEYVWRTEVRNAPLLLRGWIYQEQLLARRTIYFGESQIFWECHSGRSCEMQPSLDETQAKFDHLKTIKMQANLEGRTIPEGPDVLFDSAQRSLQLISALSSCPAAEALLKEEYSDVKSLSRLWLQLVTVYSTRRLTDNNDRLLAIAGIATVFESVAKDEYIAGYWRKQLPAQLLWRRRRQRASDRDKYFGSRPRSGGAPSWSWASVDDEIDFFVRDYNPIHTVAQVLKAEVDPLYGNLYGQMRSGRLRLRCPIVRVSPDVRGTVSLESTGDLLLPSTDNVLEMPQSALDSAQDFEEVCKDKECRFILAIMQTRDEIITGGDQIKIMYGLLLVGAGSSKDEPVNEYRRIGAVEIKSPRVSEIEFKLSCIPDSWNDIFRYPWDETGEYVKEETSLDFDSVDYLTTLDII